MDELYCGAHTITLKFVPVDYIKEYKKFINSYHVNDALRVTIGVSLPAMVFAYFGLFPVGLLISLGALSVSAADVAGPLQRRLTGMIITLFLVFIIAIVVELSNPHPFLLGVVIAVLCFALSFIGIYGTRANAVGFAGLIIMVLSMDRHQSGWEIIGSAAYLAAGGSWYILLSLLLFRLMPYKIIQQALGESIFFIGDYLKIRSYFYDKNVDYEKTYRNLMEEQQKVHDRQELLREMIFKSRTLIRQSTVTGRTLLIIFLESIDLFEKASGTIYDYRSMHKNFDGTEILPNFRKIILSIADELHNIGIAVQSGQPSPSSENLNKELRSLKKDFDVFVNLNRSPENLEALVLMRKILEAVEDMVIRIYTLHNYTAYDRKKIKQYKTAGSYDSFVPPTDLGFDLLKENLSFSSNTFRHALRVSLACCFGYFVSRWMLLGYSYWVLLTILVILKPSFSLSRQRNIQRLLGTLAGAVLGVGLLFLIPSQPGLLIAVVLLMLASNSFMRTNYFFSVTFLTAYVLLFFFMMDSKKFGVVITDRIIDTVIGSVIAFVSTRLLVPSWEKGQIKNFIAKALEKSSAYFFLVTQSFTKGGISEMKYRMIRKDAFVAQTNVSGAFTRMLNEPKSKQQNIQQIHQLVVLIYTLNSHIVTLADFAQKYSTKYQTQDFVPIADEIAAELADAQSKLSRNDGILVKRSSAYKELREEMRELVNERNRELQQGLMETETKTTLVEYKPIVDQFLFISRIAEDVKRVVGKV